MKRNILLLLLLTLTTSGLMAQRKVSFAVDAGADFTTFLSSQADGRRTRTSFRFSPSLTTRIDLRLGNSGYYLSSGLSYFAPGTYSEGLNNDLLGLIQRSGLGIDLGRIASVQERMTAHYLALPLLFGGRTILSQDGKLSITGELGVRFALGIAGSLDYDIYDSSSRKLGNLSAPLFYVTGKVTNNRPRSLAILNPFYVGAQFGVRFEYGRFYLRASTELGLTNLNKFAQVTRITTSTISTSLGVRF